MTVSSPALAPTRPTSAQPLLMLAMDQRRSLERDLYGLSEPPTPVRAARIIADKLLVFQGLLEALPHLPAGVRPCVLVDELYGSEVARAVAGGPIELAMPIEASGHDWFVREYGDDWREHLGGFAPGYGKLKVRDNPGLAAGDRAAQFEQLASVSAGLADQGRPLILELQVPPLDGDLAAVHADRTAYEQQVRPALTVQVMHDLQHAGVEPAIWQIEGLDTAETAQQIAAAARRDGRASECMVLGRHASSETLGRWLDIAAPVDGFAGFAIGASIWRDALLAHLNQGASQAAVRTAVATAYLAQARRYATAANAG